MNRDIHLAKRCYDLAAETSTDAKVPVALALLKLQFIYKLEALKEVGVILVSKCFSWTQI
jgi:SEL1 protein